MPSFYYYKGGIMPTIKSTLYLCHGVPLDPNYSYTLDFDYLDRQKEYFDNKVYTQLIENEDYSYIRDSEDIKVQANIEDLRNVNYLFYENADKRYYAFITKKEYVNPTTTRIKFEIDVMQTFMFDYDLNECFVAREHQNSWQNAQDTNYIEPIYNVEPENIEVGEDYNITTQSIDEAPQQVDGLCWVEILATENLRDNSTSIDVAASKLMQHNISTGIYAYLIPLYLYDNTATNPNFQIKVTIDGVTHIQPHYALSILSSSTAVLSYRVLHKCPVNYTSSLRIDGNNTILNITIPSGVTWITPNKTNFGGVNATVSNIGYIINLYDVNYDNFNYFVGKIKKPTPLLKYDFNNPRYKGYEPKLKIYPYEFIHLTDNQSQPLIVKNENIDQDKNIYYIQSCGLQSKSKIYLRGYMGDYGKHYNSTNSTINELPLSNSAYTSYLAQNKGTATTGIALNTALGITSLGAGLVTGGIGLLAGLGMAFSQGQNIANHIIKMRDLKETPDSIRQTGNNIEFDIIDDNLGIQKRVLTIKDEYKDKLYNYLYHYGYACNNFKVPDTRSRYYFNYIKTIGATLRTNIDSEWADKIKQVYDNGITIWHFRDGNTFKGVNNYDYENVQVNLLGGNNGE